MKFYLLFLVALLGVVLAVQSTSEDNISKQTNINKRSSNVNRENEIKPQIMKIKGENKPLKCHYPFSHLFRWPVYVTKYEINCNQVADSFEFLNENARGDNSTASITIDKNSGLLTIIPGEPPFEVKNIVAVYAGNKSYEFEIRIDSANNIDTPGIHYNYTTYLQHNCHKPWINPNNPRKNNAYTPTFHGYENLGEFGDLFPDLRYIPYTLYITWNMTINEEDDYSFYVSIYDTAELYVDGVKIIDGFQICSTDIVYLNGTVHLNKGRHSFLAFVESYTAVPNDAYFVIHYSKTSQPMERYPLPAVFWDDLYTPVLELSTDKDYYLFLENARSSIALSIGEGYRLNCSCQEELPKGLSFNWDYVYIEGYPEEVQEKKYYHISCMNIHSVTNVIEISIEIKSNIRQGLIAYYTKPKNAFDEYCYTVYDPERDDTDIYVVRHEDNAHHNVTVNGRFPDLPIDLSGEYSMVLKGYVIIKKSGNYKIVVKNSDTISFTVGDYISLTFAICRDTTTTAIDVYLDASTYPFYLGYANNLYEPYMDLKFMLDGEETDYEYIYIPKEDIEYNYTVATYHFNETIVSNRILNPPENITKVTISPELPEGISINELTGEITGTPLIENMDKKKYTIMIETVNSKFMVFIEIRLKNFVIPGGFYIHDLLTGKDYDEPPTFKHGTKVDFEIYNKEGIVTNYIVYNEVPGLTVDTSNGHLRMKGVTSSSYNLIDFNFKASDGQHFRMGEAVAYLEPLCQENEKLHIFLYNSTYEESSVKLEISSIDGTSHNQVSLSHMINETHLCLVPGDYRFYVDNIVNDFSLNLTVDGKLIFSKKYNQYKTYDEVLTTKYKRVSVVYNHGERLYLKQYEYFSLYPEVTGCIYQFTQPYPHPETFNYDIETGLIEGYYTRTGDQHMLLSVRGCDGSLVNTELKVTVERNSDYYECLAAGKIPVVFVFHIEDEEKSKYMSLSMSGSDDKEIYSGKGYKSAPGEGHTDLVCTTDDDYTLHLYDTNPKFQGWKNNYVIVKVNDLVYGQYNVKENQHINSVPLHLHPYLHSKIEWSYSYHYLEDYYKYNTQDNWEKSLFDKIPTSTTNTTYIRYYFDINKDKPYVSSLISLNYLSGIIVYINEMQIYKINMDYDEYDENTPASDYNDLITNVKFLIPLDIMKSEKTLIAVELHKHDSETKYPHFNMTVDLLDDHDGCTNLEDYSGFVKTYYPKDKSLYDTNVKDVFRNNDKYWATSLPEDFKSGNDNILIEYNFGENNYFYPNQLYIESYAEDDDKNYTVNANPKSISVQGRDSTTISSTTLIEVDDLSLNEKKSSKYVRFFGNSNGFNTIRLNISSVNNDEDNQFNINKFRLISCRNSYCPALGNLPSTSAGDIVSVACKNEASTSKTFECMNGVNPKWKEIENYCEEEPMILNTIENIVLTKNEYVSESIGDISGINILYSAKPELPKCLSIENGLIRGKCDELMDKTEYEITIKNDYGESKMTIYITIKESDYPVINMKDNVITINSGVLYKEEKIFDVAGKNLSYLIDPLLPNGIRLESNGLLNGFLEEEIDNAEYILTVKNENRTIYYPIYLTAKLTESPNVVYLVDKVTLHYGINYKKLSLYNVYGKELTFANETILPGNLELDKKTGLLTGEIEMQNINCNEKIIIRAETQNNHSDMNIEYSIKIPSIPTLVSYSETINITYGEYVKFYTGNVVGDDITYSINNLPNGLKMNNLTGEITGVTVDILTTTRKCTVNVANLNGCVFYDVTLNLIYPKKPVIVELHKENVFVPGLEIMPYTLVKAIGENVTYEIEPELPEGIKLIKSNGIIYGKSNEMLNSTNYELIIKSAGETITEEIIIIIEEVYCAADGKWPETLVGTTAEIPCDVKGTEKRECLLIDGKGVWGEIESNCYGISSGALAVLICVCSVFVIGLIISLVYYLKCVRKEKPTKTEEIVNIEKPLL